MVSKTDKPDKEYKSILDSLFQKLPDTVRTLAKYCV